MWQLTIVSSLILSSYCLAAPQQQQQPGINAGDNVDDLLSDVFGNKNAEVGGGLVTPTPEPGSLKDLINQVFKDNNKPIKDDNLGGTNNGAGSTILGTDNIPTGSNCKCVPYYQCQNGTILTNGMGLIDIRLGGSDGNTSMPTSACENYLDVCCSPPDVLENKVTPPPPARNGCGRRHDGGVGFRITGDKNNEAQFGEFPWMVAIIREERILPQQPDQVMNIFQCGGALIHPQAVLTAAHCVIGKKPAQLKVRAGEWDTQTKNEIFPHQDREVSKIVIHDQFNSGALFNDFAILILSHPFEYAENVDIVCLPLTDDRFDASRCFATGWGKDVYGQKGHYQVILKKVELPVVPHAACQDALRTTRLGHYFNLDRSFVCAGGEPGMDTCKGDGGSPLVCPLWNDPNRYVQAGIVAWGIRCGDTGIPGVYANVAGARRWIDDTMAYNNLDTSEYRY